MGRPNGAPHDNTWCPRREIPASVPPPPALPDVQPPHVGCLGRGQGGLAIQISPRRRIKHPPNPPQNTRGGWDPLEFLAGGSLTPSNSGRVVPSTSRCQVPPEGGPRERSRAAPGDGRQPARAPAPPIPATIPMPPFPQIPLCRPLALRGYPDPAPPTLLSREPQGEETQEKGSTAVGPSRVPSRRTSGKNHPRPPLTLRGRGPPPGHPYRPTTFFSDQLASFELWIHFGAGPLYFPSDTPIHSPGAEECGLFLPGSLDSRSVRGGDDGGPTEPTVTGCIYVYVHV